MMTRGEVKNFQNGGDVICGWPLSLACPKDPTSPFRMGPPRESSVRNLLEKVGNLRDSAVLVQLNLAFLTFIDLHLHSQTVSDYHPLLLNGLY